MKRLTLLFTFQLICFCLLGQAKDESYYKDLSKAIGYAYGVKHSINLIQKEYKDLSGQAMLAQLEFDQAHGKALYKVENELFSRINEPRDIHLARLREILNTKKISYQEAEAFLSNFSNERVFGNHKLLKNFVQILLRHNPNYIKYPANEFLNNYRELYSSKNHPKAKGLNLTLEYPSSWINKDGKRPNVVQTFKSYDNSCLLILHIMDLLQEMDTSDLTEEEFNYIRSNKFAEIYASEVLNEEMGMDYIRDLKLKNISNYEFKRTIIDGQSAAIYSVNGTMNSLLINDKRIKMVLYIIPYKNYLASFLFNIPHNKHSLEKEGQYLLLTKLIVSSIIFPNKW